MDKQKLIKSRGLKFTILTIFVILLIATYLGIGMFFMPSAQANNTIVENPVDGLPTDDEGSGSLPNGSNDDDEEIILPVDPLALVNYSLNNLRNSAGYKADIKIDFNATGSWGSLAELKLQQLIKGNLEYSDGKSLEELYFYYYADSVSPFMLNMGYILDEYRAIYLDYNPSPDTVFPETEEDTNDSSSDQEKTIAYLVGTKECDAMKETFDLTGEDTRFEVKSCEEMLNQYKIIYSLPLQTVFTSSNSYCSGYPSETKLYKSIQIKVYNSAIPYECRAYYNGLVGDIPVIDQGFFKGLTYTFVINKQTGELARMIIQHDIQGGVNVLGSEARVKALVQYQIDYQIMDESFEVSRPFESSVKYQDFISPKETTLEQN